MKRYVLTMVGLFLLLYILPLGVRPLITPDEVRYAEIPREMIQSGDWVVPHLNGLRYFEKPVMGYWLTAVSMRIFGENAFAVRLPSALAVGMSALLLFWWVRRSTPSHRQGMVSAAVFLTCPLVIGIGTFNMLDSALSLFVTGAMVFYFFGHMEKVPSKRIGWMVLFGVSCGLAFLTKGFIAFAIPVISIVPFMIWEGRFKDLIKISWLPIVAAILVCLPWTVMIHIREPDFWNYFFWTEHIKRFMSDHAQHPKPFWYFLPVLCLGAFQWIVLFPAVISGMRKIRKKDPLVRFAVCWLVFPFLFFSMSSGKLGTYILPCFPPLAYLLAKGLLQYFENKQKRKFTLGALSLAVFVTVCAAVLITVQISGWGNFRPFSQAETWKWLAVVACLLGWGVFLVSAVMIEDTNKRLFLYGIGPFLLMFCAQFVVPQAVLQRKAPGEFLIKNAHWIRPDSIIVADDVVRAACWFYRRSDIFLFMSKCEFKYGLGYSDSSHLFLTAKELHQLVTGPKKHRVIAILDSERGALFSPFLPTPRYKDTNGRWVFISF